MKPATARWQDWASFALGLWLAMSPWLLDYAEDEAATANAACVGLVLALGAHFEASFDELSAEWLNLAVGVWLVLAPLVLGFGSRPEAAATCVAAGMLAAALAASALSLDKEIGRWWHERIARS
jgi:hypothetical protein